MLNFSFCNEFDLAVNKREESTQRSVDSIFSMHLSSDDEYFQTSIPHVALVILSSIKEAQSFLVLFPSDGVRNLFLTVSSEKNNQN